MGHGCVLWEGWLGSQPLAFVFCIVFSFCHLIVQHPPFSRRISFWHLYRQLTWLASICAASFSWIESHEPRGWLVDVCIVPSFFVRKSACQILWIADVPGLGYIGISMLRVEHWRLLNIALVKVPPDLWCFKRWQTQLDDLKKAPPSSSEHFPVPIFQNHLPWNDLGNSY